MFTVTGKIVQTEELDRKDYGDYIYKTIRIVLEKPYKSKMYRLGMMLRGRIANKLESFLPDDLITVQFVPREKQFENGDLYSELHVFSIEKYNPNKASNFKTSFGNEKHQRFGNSH